MSSDRASVGKPFLEGVVSTTVDVRVYTLQSILKTCHSLTKSVYVHAQLLDEHSVEVSFKAKSSDQDVNEIAGRFMNQLLDQALREKLAEETEPVRNLILAHALSDTCLFRPEFEEAAPQTDPLRIAESDQKKS